MDPVSVTPTSSVNNPKPLAENAVKNKINPPVQELPHLVVGEEKRSKLGVFGVIALSIMLLGLPVGIYLAGQRTQLSPQAAVIPVTPEILSGIFMESKLTSSSDSLVPVDIYVKSPLDNINLVNTQIKFDPSLVNIEKIATSSGELAQPPAFNKWIESTFDNTKGTAAIIAGTPNPGLKSDSEGKLFLATLYIRPKKQGTAILQIGPSSELLRNSDNVNLFKTGNDLVLNLTSVSESTPSATPKRGTTEEPIIVITSPISAQNYSYFKTLDILWSGFDVERISQINLFVNGEKLGVVGQNVEASAGKFSWQPKETLALHYIQPANTYEIEIIAISKNGAVAQTKTGPFGILGTETVTGSVPSGETFVQNQLSVTDASRALSGYLVEPLKDASLDLNKDGVINDLDLFLIKQNMISRGIIK